MRPFLFALLGTSLLAQLAWSQGSPTWEQHVAYEMDITLLADVHELRGTQRLTYTNNSPDTLRQVFYHLYFNAFEPTSMMAERNRALPDPDGRIVPRIFQLGPEEVGYHRVRSLTQDGTPVRYYLTDTVLRVELAQPIPPNTSTTFEMVFRSQVPLQTRRSGRDSRGGGVDFSMAQWYPKMAGYDERGWHPDPYVGREFYAPFGTFDVRIQAPSNYVLGASGVLQNPEEVGHGYDRTPTMPPPSAAADSLTWHFVAEQVHDFAWGADPDYLHEVIEMVGGPTLHILYKPDVAPSWRPLREYLPRMVRYFNDRFGNYVYPQFTVIQGADGGMEYPMLTLISGYGGPSYTTPRPFGSILGTTVHEFAHMWYYGFLASNEADYSWIDEGFVTYATTEAMAHLLGRPANHTGRYLSYLSLHDRGLAERLSTPADWFTTNSAFGATSYSAGAMVVDMLGAVIGDQTRDEFLLEFYERFLFRHPNPYDIEKVAEDVSGLQLDWYFEQFTNTTWTLDYGVGQVRSSRQGNEWTSSIQLHRHGEMVMPLDVRLTLDNGTQRRVLVPLGIMQGHKEVSPDVYVADPWLWTSETYTLRVPTPRRVTKVEIDPGLRMPDRNRLNNVNGVPIEAAFLEPPAPSWSSYSVGYRPLLGYGFDYGFGAGLQARGAYIFRDHQARAMFRLWPEVLASGGSDPNSFSRFRRDTGTFFDGIDYELAYSRRLRSLDQATTISVSAAKHLGFLEHRVAVARPLGRWVGLGRTLGTVTVSLLHQYNPSRRVFQPYRPQVDVLPFGKENAASVQLHYALARGLNRVEATLETGSSLTTGGSTTRAWLRLTRGVIGRAGYAQAHLLAGAGPKNLIGYKRFVLGGATPEAAWQHDAYRSIAAGFEDPQQDARLVPLDAPGPRAYLLEGGLVGRHVLAGTLDATLTPFTGPNLQPFGLGLFSGAGFVNQQRNPTPGLEENALVADAGLTASFDFSRLPGLQRAYAQSDVLRQLQVVASFPFWVSHPELLNETDELAFRWSLGLQFSP
ncbi:MAG: M1 family metallopeptidase [Bacteroidota bacterium]